MDNPCDRLLPVLGFQHDLVRHRRALPHREVGAATWKVLAVGGEQSELPPLFRCPAHGFES